MRTISINEVKMVKPFLINIQFQFVALFLCVRSNVTNKPQ